MPLGGSTVREQAKRAMATVATHRAVLPVASNVRAIPNEAVRGFLRGYAKGSQVRAAA
jgi:hypothetical protein